MSINPINNQKRPIVKDIFKIKLKERKTIKSLSNKKENKNKNISLIIHNKKDINSYIKEKKYEDSIKNYLDLKHKIFLKEKKEEKRLKAEEDKKQTQFNFSKIVINKFKRDKHKIRKIYLNEDKKGIVTTSKEIHNNKMNSILEKIWMKYNEENNKEKDYTDFINIFDQTIEKQKIFLNKINKRTKNFNSLFDIRTKNIKKLFGNFSVINKSKYTNIFGNKTIKKRRLNSANIINKINFIQNNENTCSTYVKLTSSSLMNTKNKKDINEIKNTANKNKFISKIKKINKIHINSSTSKVSQNKNKIIYKYITPKIGKKPKLRVKNLPIYTVKLSDIVNDYNKVKIDCDKKNIKYIENDFLTYDKFNSIIETKEDLLLFKLKRKFLENRFPPKKKVINKENKRDTFIQKIKNDVEFLDKPLDFNLNYLFNS